MTNVTTAAAAIDAMLALYAKPGTWTPDGIAWDREGQPVPAGSPDAAAWSVEGALHAVIGDPGEDGISRDEERRRDDLTCDVFAACGVDPCQLGDAAQGVDVIITVLRTARA